MNLIFRFWVGILTLSILSACVSRPPLQHAEGLKVADMMGDWYVVSQVPHWSEKDCCGSLLRLRLLRDQRVDTRFIAHKKGFYGRKYLVKGMTETGPARELLPWKIRFISGLYSLNVVVLELAENGRYAILITTDRRRAWILSRQRQMSASDYEAAILTLENQGFSHPAFSPGTAGPLGLRGTRARGTRAG